MEKNIESGMETTEYRAYLGIIIMYRTGILPNHAARNGRNMKHEMGISVT